MRTIPLTLVMTMLTPTNARLSSRRSRSHDDDDAQPRSRRRDDRGRASADRDASRDAASGDTNADHDDFDADDTSDSRRSRRSRRPERPGAPPQPPKSSRLRKTSSWTISPTRRLPKRRATKNPTPPRTRSRRRRRRRGSRGETGANGETIPPRTMPKIRVPAVVTIAMIMTVIAMRTMRSRPLLAVAVAVVAARTAEGTDDQSQEQRTAAGPDAPASSSTSTRSLMWRAPLVSRARSSAAVTTAVSAAARASSWNRTPRTPRERGPPDGGAEKEHHTQISGGGRQCSGRGITSPTFREVQTVGNIYLGRVQNVLPSMEAAFVDIGQARNGVLYAGEVNWDAARLEGQPRRIELAFKSGDPVLVQVTKDLIGPQGCPPDLRSRSPAASWCSCHPAA